MYHFVWRNVLKSICKLNYRSYNTLHIHLELVICKTDGNSFVRQRWLSSLLHNASHFHACPQACPCMFACTYILEVRQVHILAEWLIVKTNIILRLNITMIEKQIGIFTETFLGSYEQFLLSGFVSLTFGCRTVSQHRELPDGSWDTMLLIGYTK